MADKEMRARAKRRKAEQRELNKRATAERKAGKLFPCLSTYGNYEASALPSKGLHHIPLDGSIKIANKLRIPSVKLVRQLWLGQYPEHVGYVIPIKYKRRFVAALAKDTAKQAAKRTVSPHPDLLLCIREASKEAHRCRDEASSCYQTRRYRHLASDYSAKKSDWYALKDAGIIAAHKLGLLRYVGASPQGMAIYEYGEGGMSCFHSTLHPVGIERTPITDHPETLFVATKEKAKGISLERVRVTLDALPEDFSGYERSAAPRIARSQPTCWQCGEEGHIARHCPMRESFYSDEREMEECFA